MRGLAAVCLGALAITAARPAEADTLSRVRAEGVLHCGAVIRPGLSFPNNAGVFEGLEVDVCRAIAAAVLGAPDKIDFDPYVLPKTYDPIRDGRQQVFFLTTSEILAQNLIGTVLPGPAVFYETHQLMVPHGSTAQRMADLAGKEVCVEPGTGPERTVEHVSKVQKIDLHIYPFQEPVEEIDAFSDGLCGAMAQEVTTLAALKLGAPAGKEPTILPDVMAVAPIFAATNTDDGKWAAIVAWTVNTLLRAEPAQSGDPAGRADSLPVAGGDLGLEPGWQARALAAGGHYGTIFARNLGSESPLGLPRGLNAAWSDHGVMAAPYSE